MDQFQLPPGLPPGGKSRVKVLSLSGGGYRGLFTASVIQSLETQLSTDPEQPTPFGQHFDLIAGTSIGGILALPCPVGLRAATWLPYCEIKVARSFRQCTYAASASSSARRRTTRITCERRSGRLCRPPTSFCSATIHLASCLPRSTGQLPSFTFWAAVPLSTETTSASRSWMPCWRRPRHQRTSRRTPLGTTCLSTATWRSCRDGPRPFLAVKPN